MKMRKILFVMTITAAMSMGMAMTSLADWSESGGRWYYYNDNSGKMVQNDWVKYNDKWYYMDPNGVMATNSFIDDTYYVDSNGTMVNNGWVFFKDRWSGEGGWRYFGSNGRVIADGWKNIGDTRYHFTDTVMDTGWYHTGDATYYLGKSGAMTTGWRKIQGEDDEWGESWYYFGSTGKMESGTEKKISGETYIFDGDGRMLTGWVNPSDGSSSGRDDLTTTKIDSLKYYRSGGQRADGWLWLMSPDDEEEYWYYFKDGRAYSSGNGTTAIGSYGMAKIKGETYCFNARGQMITGMVEINDGRKFYFDPDSGKMRTGRVVVNDDTYDNEVFYFTTTGSLGNKGDGFTGVKDGSLYDEGNLVQAEEGMKYEKVSVGGKNYVVNEQGKVKTSGTVTDADGVKYKITRESDGTYKIEVIK